MGTNIWFPYSMSISLFFGNVYMLMLRLKTSLTQHILIMTIVYSYRVLTGEITVVTFNLSIEIGLSENI